MRYVSSLIDFTADDVIMLDIVVTVGVIIVPVEHHRHRGARTSFDTPPNGE